MSHMADMHTTITLALERGERPANIATRMGCPVLMVWTVLADVLENQ
tara:strand:+ start:91 stop:231 length:141 start_codon:yes stop_codon:yes gene_type:complete